MGPELIPIKPKVNRGRRPNRRTVTPWEISTRLRSNLLLNLNAFVRTVRHRLVIRHVVRIYWRGQVSPAPPRPHGSEGESGRGGCRLDVARISMSRLTRTPHGCGSTDDAALHRYGIPVRLFACTLGSPLSYDKVYPHASGLGVVVHHGVNRCLNRVRMLLMFPLK